MGNSVASEGIQTEFVQHGGFKIQSARKLCMSLTFLGFMKVAQSLIESFLFAEDQRSNMVEMGTKSKNNHLLSCSSFRNSSVIRNSRLTE